MVVFEIRRFLGGNRSILWTSQVAQWYWIHLLVQETQVQCLGQELPWRRKWQPTPVFLPGGFHEQRSLVDYSPWGHKESDASEATEYAQMRSILYAEVNYSFRLFKVCSQLLGKNVTLFHITFFPALSKSQILLIFLSQVYIASMCAMKTAINHLGFTLCWPKTKTKKSKFRPTKS